MHVAHYRSPGRVFLINAHPVIISLCRGVQGKDFEDLIDRLRSILLSSDRGPNCLTLLRQLYVLTAASKYNRKYVGQTLHGGGGGGGGGGGERNVS